MRDGQPVKIGSRALDVLVILTERAGEIVTKEELIAKVWPDTAVEESGIRVHVAALRKALGDGAGGARYVTNVPGRGYSFVAPVERSTSLGHIAGTARALASELPARLERILGRDTTIREIVEQVRASRFVSIVGPGGMGKTTVAVALAHAVLEDFAGDVSFVDLGSLREPHQIASALCSALGFAPVSQDLAASLPAFLRDRRMLVVLDSCEHLIDAVAPLAERLVAAAGVHVLTTSREPLRVEGEHVHRLAPLASPPEASAIAATEALAFPAVELFVERATASGTRFVLSDDDAPVVSDLCRRLDGIALAIEFAAGRVEAYGIRGTASLLENRFKLLWHGRRTALPRHQTLSALLDWSYNLLDGREQRALRRLSILVGIFSLDDAAGILDEEDAIGTLGSLVDKSLISVDTRGSEGPRYRLLDTTRAYAHAKLSDAGELQELAKRHAQYVCAMLECERNHDREMPARSLARYLGNARAALDWSFSNGGDPRLAVRLATEAVSLFMELSLLRECARWAEAAMALLEPSDRGTRREMDLRAALGVAAMFTKGNGPEVREALSSALALADEVDEPREQLRLLGALNILLTRTAEWREGLLVGQRSEAVAARLDDDPAARSLADWMIGTCRHLLGDQVAAEARCRSALEPTPTSRSTAMLQFGFDHRVRALIVLARALWLLGRVDDALRVADRAIRDAAEIGQPTTVAISLVWTSSVYVWCGDFERAEEVVERLVVYAEKHSLGPYIPLALGLRGELLVKRGNFAGVELLRKAGETLRAGRHDLLQTVFATAIAEGLAGAGRFEDALQTIDAALALAKRNDGESFDLPEMLRFKGRVLLAMPSRDETLGERYLRQALDHAREQNALGWELRAATALAELYTRRADKTSARAILEPVYSRYDQGLGTADLLAAKDVLSTL
ncbi:transcriptional regulator [Labilithrix luteola]|uniref:Transcriptional regulator n=1 Tax=Labilithrix luteola TaxID=1391654 RepID=A0A0K1PWH9_9BACT|nr:transcriptional regulator [Labilithrix luteola]